MLDTWTLTSFPLKMHARSCVPSVAQYCPVGPRATGTVILHRLAALFPIRSPDSRAHAVHRMIELRVVNSVLDIATDALL